MEKEKYFVNVPKNANDFQYDQKTYGAGSKFETDSYCEAIDFYNALKTTNPEKAKKDATKDFWSTAYSKCNGKVPESPQPVPTTQPSDSNPTSAVGDAPSLQGAPSLPPSGTVEGASTSNGTVGDGSSNTAPTNEPTRPPEGEANQTHSDEQSQTQTNAGDPVDIFQGAFYLQEIDLEIPNTILPFAFVRTYRSGAASYGPFGWNWDHNFNLYLRELNDGNIALWRNLHEDIFKFDGANFEPPRGVFEKLERITALAQIYEIKGKGGLVMRFERPNGWVDGERIPLLWIKDQHGNQLKFSYGTEDKLVEVIDDDDRYLRFDYDKCGLLVAVYDHANRKYTYEHDEQTMHLVCVNSPGTMDHPNGIHRIYHYEEPWTLPELRHNIVRVEDSEGNVYLENTYDQDPASWSYSRVTEQLFGGFLYQFQYTQLQWVPENPIYINIPAVRVEVMNPDYGLETYTFNYRGDLLDRRYRLSKDKSFRVVAWLYEFDEQGNPSKVTSPDGSEEINTFDFSNTDPRMRSNLLQKEITAASGFPAPSRIIWKGKYESTYQLLTEEKNESGQITQYKYDFDITPIALTDTGKLIRIIQPDTTLPDGTVQSSIVSFEYNPKGQLTATILPDGTRNENQYGLDGNEKSRLIKQVYDVGGADVENTIKYDVAGYQIETIDGNNNSTQYSVNAIGQIEKITLPPTNGMSAEYRIHYDSDKKVSSFERPRGAYSDPILTGSHIIDHIERDVLGYPTKFWFSTNTAEQHELQVCHDFRGMPQETINPDGSTIRQIYDERGMLINEKLIGKDDAQIDAMRVFDRDGKLVQETNSFGQTTRYEYDGFSRIAKIVQPNGSELRYKWLADDLLESEEVIGDDGNGVIRQLTFKSYAYDEKGRRNVELIKSFEDNPAVATYVKTTSYYDQRDRLIKIIDNRGGVRVIEYDGLDRIRKQIDPAGNEQRFNYDNNGNITLSENHHVEPDGSISIFSKYFSYDSRNRIVEEIEPDGAKLVFEYDDRDMLIKYTDRLGIIHETKYNSLGNKVQETQDVAGLNIVHAWTLDNMSRVTTYTDPTGQVSKYSIDSLGRVYKTEYPNGFSSTISFNDKGQIIEEVLGSGVKFGFVYDSANRLIRINNPVAPVPVNPIQPHQYNYDGLDRLVSAQTGTHQVLRQYDSLSRLLAEITAGNLIHCKYDDANGVIEKIWPDGRTEKHIHDLNGVLTQIEETNAGGLGAGVGVIASLKTSGDKYFGEGTYRGGLKITNKYDARKRLVEIDASSHAGMNEKIKYRYDTANRKRVEAISGQNGKLTLFDFDHKYRVTTAKDSFTVAVADALTQSDHDAAISGVVVASSGAMHQEGFEYNNADERLKHTETGKPNKNYTYAVGHRIQSDGINAYNHHADGAMQSDGVFSYETDALGRVIAIKSGPNTLCKIEYDALGRPSLLEESSKPIRSFNYWGAYIAQENDNGAAARQITINPATGIPIAYHSAARTNYTLFDARFNLLGLTDISGNLIETYRYKSFGLPEIFDSTGTQISASGYGIEPVFGGQRLLSASGLYLSTRRLMNPANGLYLSADPFSYVDSPSLYVYVAQNPIDLIDPEGEFAWFIPILIGMAIGAGISAYANRNKKGKDFLVSVGAGAVSGGIMGTGYGLVSFALGGAVGGAIMGGYEGGAEGALIQGSIGAVGGLVGGAIGGRASTAIAGRLYGTLISRMSSPIMATQVSQYAGVGIGGATAGFYGSLSQGGLSLMASGVNPLDHLELLLNNASEGTAYGFVGGVSSKAIIQGSFYKSFKGNGRFEKMLGDEAEFYVQNQTMQGINRTNTVPNINSNANQAKIPDLLGKIIGDVKNTSKIPSLRAQNSQLASFLQAARANGQRMKLFHRPGVTAGPRSGIARAGDIDLVPIRQFTPPFQPIHPNETISSK